jgi:hypothetical protein
MGCERNEWVSGFSPAAASSNSSIARENLMKNELSLQINDALSLLECVQDGGKISDYPSARSYEYMTGMVYCIRQDGTLAHSVPRETLDAVVSAKLVEPRRVSPTMWRQRQLTAEQLERLHDWEIVGYSLTEDGAEFLQSRQRNP